MKSDKNRGDEALGKTPGIRGFGVWRTLKILSIAVLGLMLVVIIAAGVLIWVVFTPQRLTPIVQKQAELHIPYQTVIEGVELTFFSTFPKFGINIKALSIVSPFAGAPSDTLIKSGNMTCIIDAMAFWKNRDIIISELRFEGAHINVYTDSLGHSNYGLLMESSASTDSKPAAFDLGVIDLKNIDVSKLWFSYIDQTTGIDAEIADASFNISGILRDDLIRGHLQLKNSCVSFAYAGDTYLKHASVTLNMPTEMDMSMQHLVLKEAEVSINGLGISLYGTMVYDSLNQQITTDIRYAGNAWGIADFMALIPPVYLSYLGEFDAGGQLAATGVIRGSISDSNFPVIEAQLSIANGNLIHEWLPVSLSQMNGDGYLFLDIYGEQVSFLSVDQLTAVSPASDFSMRGHIHDLLGDTHLDLITDVDMRVEEFASYIPDDMDLAIQGRVKGRVKSAFTLSQALDVALEKMTISGSAVLTDFCAIYDSLHMTANKAAVDFSLPNKNKQTAGKTAFAFAQIAADSLFVSLPEQYSTQISNGSFWIEMSDVRDIDRIPDVYFRYNLAGLEATMDTIHITVVNPAGELFLSPRPGAADQPVIHLDYAGKTLTANVGKDKVSAQGTSFSIEVVNDKAHEDVFQRWFTRGRLSLDHGSLALSNLSSPIDIPLIQMDFDPELFAIHESHIVIDQSDFGLSGVLKNVLSYYRGDSLLVGDFLFESDNTDLTQLMNMTSGIGAKEGTTDESADAVDDFADFAIDVAMDETADAAAGYTDPYMVPLGVDVRLKANIRKASFGPDTISNIAGDVRVRDGILLLDGINFSTPAADMQLTAMYRTPRRNHLYLGLDYHMFDIDIGRLLQMIPDIDTLMPMLRSFKGRGEFHMAIETYLDSQYQLKRSTLRGASSIRGNDLVLMDGETFSEIAKTLRFSKRAENRVDSLSAEFTIFREEVDVYPFLIVMDRYKAVVAGRHNFDLSFNYHISLVESPLPVRLGIDVTGTMDKMNYRLASPRYAEFYRPASRRTLESRQLQLRNLIRDALIRNVE